MYDYSKLKGLIREKFGTQKAYADFLGISATTLNSRFRGVSYFDQTEIEKSAHFFGSNAEEVNEIFFKKK